MDLHALSQGRRMLVVRGGIAFIAGVAASNNSTMTADSLVLLMAVWTLADGAALVRQAYPPTGTNRRAETQPGVMVLGGVGVLLGATIILAPGLSSSALIWALVAWFAVRAAAEGIGVLASTASKARVFLGLSALLDVALVIAFAMTSGGSVANLALFGGGLVSVWGCLHLALAAVAREKRREDVAVRLLATR